MATAFSRIVNQLGYKRQFLTPGCVRVIVPGLPYTAFDAYEHPQSWSVVNILDSTQISAVHESPHDNGGSLLDLHPVFAKHNTYIAASKVEFSAEMYNKNIVKYPLYMDNTVSHVGRTTLVIKTEMKTDRTTLANLRQLQVFVDKDTKRPVPIPDWWKEKFVDMIGEGEPLRFPALERPSTNKVSSVSIGQIPYSDTDSYFHLNFSNYLKYCINGIFQHRTQESGKGIPTKPLLTKSAFTWYRQECNHGDEVHIEYWKEESKSGSLCVDMLKGPSSAFQCKLDFFETRSSL